MTFFPREKSSLRNKSQHTYDYDQHYNDMLNGLNGNFTFGGSSGFTESPYEIFRQNVAKTCERFMYSSFDQDEFMSAEEKSSRALRRAGDPGFNARLAEGDASRCGHADLSRSHVDVENAKNRVDFTENTYDSEEAQCSDRNGREDCYCSSTIICEHCRARPSKSDTNIFSVMSLSFEPLEDCKANKPSLMKKITQLMNSDYISHKEKVTVTRKLPLKQQCEPSKWNACECHVHIGKHSNCCQCQEPYHRTNCECVQHNGSHSYCCRCDPHLLQEYDQHLKKKRYLRLLSDDEELSPVHSVDNQDGGIPRFPRCSPRADAIGTEECCSGMKSSARNHAIPSAINRPGTGDKSCKEKDDDTGESDNNHHPCESCCKKLDNIYGTALREVHSMLMDVSRTLLPSAHCCSLESRIQNVSRLRPSSYQIESQNLETSESNEAEPEWTKDVSGTNEVGVQVTPILATKKYKKKGEMKAYYTSYRSHLLHGFGISINDLASGGRFEKKMRKRAKNLKNKCVIS